MLKNYFKVAFRNLIKTKAYGFINIFGLSVGMAVSIIIIQYFNYQSSFDNFHENAPSIYRIRTDFYKNGGLTNKMALSYSTVGEALKETFPEVLDFSRLRPNDAIISYNNKRFHENTIFYADSSIFNVFNFPLIAGEPRSALTKPNSVVISESAAKKYFNQEDALGKTLIVNETDNYIVTGVFKEVPENSHLKFSFLFSIKGFLTSQQQQWESQQPNMFTYILLSSKADPTEFETKLPAFVDKYFGEALKQKGLSAKFILQPLNDIYLYSNLEFEASVNGDGKTLYFLLTLAFFILIVVWINYVSLSTVSAMKRNREIGVRLVMGSSRRQLVKQFLFESILINAIAVIISIFIAYFGAPLLSYYMEIRLPPLFEESAFFWLIFFIIFIFGAFLSGSYPAFVLSSFSPSDALKANVKSYSGEGTLLRKSLVVIQFTFSVILIGSTLIIYNQMNFIKNKDLGVNINQVLVIPFPPSQDIQGASENFKEEIIKYAFVKNVTTSTLIPGKGYNAENEIHKENEDQENAGLTKVIGVDYNFFKTYEGKIIEGRDFSKDYIVDAQAIILNEEAAKLLNISNLNDGFKPKVVIYGATWEVIGIVKNFHQKTVKATLDPIVFFTGPTPQYVSIRLNTNNMENCLSAIKSKWEALLPTAPFNYFFLDDFYNKQYKADQQFMDLFKLLTFLSIIISSLGLLGLTAFRVLQRTKEIGIRKVLGANIFSILYLLLKDLIVPVLISSLIAWPFTSFFMNKWLQDFATRVNVEIWWFAFSGFIVLFIALCVVSYHTLKAAVVNPVTYLRQE